MKGQADCGTSDPADYPMFETSANTTFYVQCQGCGAVRSGYWLGLGHACWRNEDGTFEEGGTFQ